MSEYNVVVWIAPPMTVCSEVVLKTGDVTFVSVIEGDKLMLELPNGHKFGWTSVANVQPINSWSIVDWPEGVM